MLEFVAFDVETTGVSAGEDHIVELGAVRFRNGEVVATFNALVNPGRPIPESATRVHGITNAMVKDSPPPPGPLAELSAFCDSSLLVAHNASFDVKFLSSEYAEYQIQPPTGLVLDSFQMAKQSLTGLLNYRLENLARHFNIQNSRYHRAEADAFVCGRVFMHLLKSLARKGKLPPRENIINLSGGELYFPKLRRQAQQLSLLG